MFRKNHNGVEIIDETTQKKAKKKKKKIKIGWIILIIILVLIVLGIRAARKAFNQVLAGTAAVTVESPKREDMEEVISLSGMVQSKDYQYVYAPASGTLKEVNVREGDLVKAGDVLAVYDMDQLELNLRQSKLQWERSEISFESMLAGNSEAGAKLTEANTNLKVLNQQIADSQAYLKELQKEFSTTQRDTQTSLTTRSYQLQQQLGSLVPGSDEYNAVQSQLSAISFQQSILGSSDYYVQMEAKIAEEQERLAGYQEYKARMESQKAQSEATALDSYAKRQLNIDRELAEISYKQVESAYETANKGILSEINGIVSSATAIKGAGVGEGMQVFTISGTDAFVISSDVSKNNAKRLNVGDAVDITLGSDKYTGEVSRISSMATLDSQGATRITIEITIDNKGEILLLGGDAKLKVHTDKVENALTIPVEAVYADHDSEFVFVEQEGKAVKRTVTTGISYNGRIEVAEGLTEQEKIIIDGIGIVEEGMDVSALLAK